MSKRIVLTEEEYFERLSAIIKRDFFPSLADATEEETASMARFQAQYTTEDNASFEELLARENERKRKAFERVHGAPAVICDDPSRRLLLSESKVDTERVKLLTGPAASTKPTINIRATRFTSNSSGSFRIPDTPSREQLGHSLASTPRSGSSVVKRTKKTQEKYNLEDLKSLTPRRK